MKISDMGLLMKPKYIMDSRVLILLERVQHACMEMVITTRAC